MCRVAERLPWPGSDCLVCSHCEAALFLSSSWRLFAKRGGKMWEATVPCHLFIFPCPWDWNQNFFVPLFFGNYSFFFFFFLYMWLLKCRLFMTSLCRLCFINDQLCGLGRGIVFIWHRLALVQSSSCREAERSQFCGFERCEKFKSPLQEPCIYNLHV